MMAAEMDMPYSIIIWTNSVSLYTNFNWFFSFENSSMPSNLSSKAAAVDEEEEVEEGEFTID